MLKIMSKRVIGVVLVIILFANLGNTVIRYIKDENYIYNKNINSVVELKGSYGILEATGTGVVVTNDGMILTNYHVVTYIEASETIVYDNIEVRLPTQDDYYFAEVVKTDSENDMALLQIIDYDESFGFKKIRFGSSDKIKTGDICYALGNVGSISISFSKGMISNRSILIEMNNAESAFIQSNIDISKGSSGGALLNEYGNLIGLTTLRLKDASGNTTYGFVYSIKLEDIIEFIN